MDSVSSENRSNRKKAIIIGAGPAGLTAAIELLRQTDVQPVILEASHEIGGISRTVQYKGNRMDIGGHRFFSKSDRVMQWWQEIMPATSDAQSCAEAPETDSDLVMLVRQRKSRIYFLRRFFDYPIQLTADTLRKMGMLRTLKCGLSYMRSAILPQREEKSLEDFLINRFGRQLYLTFFRSYTEKVWGVPCHEISAEWGAQRIKGLSLIGVVKHFLKKTFCGKPCGDIAQKSTETSLIEQFLYPKLGPGQLWEHVADLIRQKGGEIHFGVEIDRVMTEGDQVVAIEGFDKDGQRHRYTGDYFFSTMAVRDLVRAMAEAVPPEVRTVSEGLIYRDFITVGLLAKRLTAYEDDGSALKDNWIYIQEPDVTVGRLQIFNNWSPWLVNQSGADGEKIWIGLEYFCYENDSLWSRSDEEIARLAVEEISRIGILKAEDVLDAHVVRVPKTYPCYFGSYDNFDTVRSFTDGFANLFLVGRNGMHRYNNQDHSMLTAMAAVDNLRRGDLSKDNIWEINTESEYHESREEQTQAEAVSA